MLKPKKILSDGKKLANHGYEPQSKLWKLYRSKLRGIVPSAARDCSTYQFRSAAHTELEFHNNLKRRYLYKVGYTLLVLPLFLLLVSCYPPAQTVSSPASDGIAKAPSTQVYFYPKTNKTQEQQDRDRYECYNWSIEQTGFDPGSPSIPPQHRVIVRPIPPPGTSTAVGALTGATLGALAAGPRHAGGGLLIGAAIGAMFGAVSDAARQEQAQNLEQAYNKQDQVRDAQMERKASDFRRAMSACLESRGYSAQ